jgi:hypothetical protein
LPRWLSLAYRQRLARWLGYGQVGDRQADKLSIEKNEVLQQGILGRVATILDGRICPVRQFYSGLIIVAEDEVKR